MHLYHGSDKIIKNPVYGHGSKFNDYGQGFYCTREPELAKEWACKTQNNGYANRYIVEEAGLSILNLADGEYSILHWICMLIEHRRFEISTPIAQRGYDWLVENYHIDVSQYDIVVGYRADDSYFSFAKAFLTNQISIQQLEMAMELGDLGLQYVLVSEKAFEALSFDGYEVAFSDIYFSKRKERDEKAREAYREIVSKMDVKGFYIRDLMEK